MINVLFFFVGTYHCLYFVEYALCIYLHAAILCVLNLVYFIIQIVILHIKAISIYVMYLLYFVYIL